MFKSSTLIALLVIALLAATAYPQQLKRYDGHVVYRLKIENEQQLEAIEQMEGAGTIDVWTESRSKAIGSFLDVAVEPEKQSAFKMIILGELNTKYDIVVDDVQSLIDTEQKAMAQVPEFSAAKLLAGAQSNADFFDKYRTNAEFMDFLQALHGQYPDITSLFTIGKTLEGREIWGIKIGKPSSSGAPKKSLVFNSLQHAREYISGATTMYIANTLLTKYATDPQVQQFVNELDFHIIPVVNMDGYNYTFVGERLWRKNRRVNQHSSCRGVDTNRNWDYKWNATGGSSTNPCSDTYRGPSPFSEPESTAIANYTVHVPNLRAYIDFHSYSQLWMRPWGYTKDAPKDEPTMKQVGDACAAAIKATHGVVYDSGRISIIIYEASGSSVDYVYGLTGAISFGVELRDTGRYGFLLPPNQIIPTGEENWAAVTVLAKHVLESA